MKIIKKILTIIIILLLVILIMLVFINGKKNKTPNKNLNNEKTTTLKPIDYLEALDLVVEKYNNNDNYTFQVTDEMLDDSTYGKVYIVYKTDLEKNDISETYYVNPYTRKIISVINQNEISED